MASFFFKTIDIKLRSQQCDILYLSIFKLICNKINHRCWVQSKRSINSLNNLFGVFKFNYNAVSRSLTEIISYLLSADLSIWHSYADIFSVLNSGGAEIYLQSLISCNITCLCSPLRHITFFHFEFYVNLIIKKL